MKNINRKICIVVLGMHRSGTSATAGVLDILGIPMGNKLIPANEYNEKGYYEDLDVLKMNNSILKTMNSRWDIPSDFNSLDIDKISKNTINNIKRYLLTMCSKNTIFGLKDPRIPILLPLWKKMFRELRIKPYYLIVIRDPREVSVSLQKRNNMAHELSNYLWAKTYWNAFQNIGRETSVIIKYADLLNSPIKVAKQIAQEFKLPINISHEEIRNINKYIDKRLNHSAIKSSMKGNEANISQAMYSCIVSHSNNVSLWSAPIQKKLWGYFDAIRGTLLQKMFSENIHIFSAKTRALDIFYDYGQGYNTDNWMRISYSIADTVFIKKSLTLKNDLVGIRIDPSGRPCAIFALSIKIIKENAELNIGDFSNYRIIDGFWDNENKVLYCISNDPIIIIPFEAKKGDKIILKISFSYMEDHNKLYDRFCSFLHAFDKTKEIIVEHNNKVSL